MAYIVSYSKAHEAAREIGAFDDLDAAKTAARKVGAVGEPQRISASGSSALERGNPPGKDR